jgi:hypothetical protein
VFDSLTRMLIDHREAIRVSVRDPHGGVAFGSVDVGIEP